MIKSVIFDYGGVIKEAHPLSVDVATIYKMPVEEVFKVRPLLAPFFSLLQRGLIKEEDFWQEVSTILKKPLLINCKNLSRNSYEKGFSFYKETLKFVKELKKKKFITAVLSNITNFEADVIRKKKGYKEFDVLVLSYEEKTEKPEIDIYASALKKIKVRPEECIFIDDREENLLPAIKMGMKTVLAQNPKQIKKDVYSIIDSQK